MTVTHTERPAGHERERTGSVAPAATPSMDDVRLVADSFGQLVRSFTRMRSQMLAAAQHDVEWSAHVILKAVDRDGPLRASALAEVIESDPSTVSRQVAALVRDGLIERQADPVDGRASLLVVTPKAAEILADHDAVRLERFGRMLSDWNERDLRRFGALLQRFTHDFDKAKTDWPLPGRPVTHDVPAEGEN